MPPGHSVVVFVSWNQINPAVISQRTVPVYFAGRSLFIFCVFFFQSKVSADKILRSVKGEILPGLCWGSFISNVQTDFFSWCDVNTASTSMYHSLAWLKKQQPERKSIRKALALMAARSFKPQQELLLSPKIKLHLHTINPVKSIVGCACFRAQDCRTWPVHPLLWLLPPVRMYYSGFFSVNISFWLIRSPCEPSPLNH